MHLGTQALMPPTPNTVSLLVAFAQPTLVSLIMRCHQAVIVALGVPAKVWRACSGACRRAVGYADVQLNMRCH